jgi:hypothetical protein
MGSARAICGRVRNSLLTLGCIPFLAVGPIGARAPAANCDTWLDKALTRMEKRGEQTWRDSVIGLLAEAPCRSIPTELRTAFRAAKSSKSAAEQDRLLAAAASTVLGPTCAVQNPMNDARLIASVCPLPQQPELQISHALRDILSVDYVVLNAIATSLLRGNEYEASAKRLVMDFALSASLRGERVRESRRGAK